MWAFFVGRGVPSRKRNPRLDAMTQVLLRWHMAPPEQTVVNSDPVQIGRY
jgi:hypothetical protein